MPGLWKMNDVLGGSLFSWYVYRCMERRSGLYAGMGRVCGIIDLACGGYMSEWRQEVQKRSRIKNGYQVSYRSRFLFSEMLQ